MVDPKLTNVFPALRDQPFQITSPINDKYNCIAFAAGDNRNWWWPDALGDDTWPPGIARVETIEAFRDAFAVLGYVVWTSKLGPMEDIEHALHDLAGTVYGAVALVMKRTLPTD